MEPHELAMAALSQVAQSSRDGPSHRAPDEPPSRPSGSRITNKSSVDKHARVPLPLGLLSETGLATSQSGRGQESQGRDSTTTSNNSQSTNDGYGAASTPPTPSPDALSSQSTNAEGALSQLPQLSQLAAAQQPVNNASVTRNRQVVSSTAGQKRTADGEVKPGSSSSPELPQIRGHSRNASAISNVSTASTKIGEVRHHIARWQNVTNPMQLSSELRTRLSYAMVKVNNGWQSHSIDEVESLASQKGSPTSSTSTEKVRRNPLASPRTVMFANAQGQSSSMHSITQAPTADFDLYSNLGQPSRTYESFWRDHSATSHPSNKQSSTSCTTTPPSKSLAPPADIRPQHTPRRSGTPKFSKPPTIPNHGSNSDYQSSAPHTPRQSNMRENGTMQTTSKKTIQEQDAIETLLFMSSPGHSGNMGHTFPPPRTQASPQASPLRAEFGISLPPPRFAQGKRVDFNLLPSSRSTESSEAGTAAGESRSSQTRGDAIDRLLDEMADESSDDEEIVLNYSSPRRVTAGRV